MKVLELVAFAFHLLVAWVQKQTVWVFEVRIMYQVLHVRRFYLLGYFSHTEISDGEIGCFELRSTYLFS